MIYRKSTSEILDDIKCAKEFIATLQSVATKYPSVLEVCGQLIRVEINLLDEARRELKNALSQ